MLSFTQVSCKIVLFFKIKDNRNKTTIDHKTKLFGSVNDIGCKNTYRNLPRTIARQCE